MHSTLGIESCVVALTAAAVMLIIGKQDAEDIIANVEWSTIVFFIGLFCGKQYDKKDGRGCSWIARSS